MALSDMEFISLLNGEEDRFGTRHVQLWQAGVFDGVEKTRVHVARFGKDSLLGRHPTRMWQLFMVIEGFGWVSAEDHVRYPISTGQAVLLHPGEEHDSGSETGMSVLILASSTDPRGA
ncbi:MAG: AraC family ligand binding domain-containing protein [Candidatus Nanopelagicaceae bacterium]